MPNQFISLQEGDLENYFVSEYWLIDQWVGDTLWLWGDNSYGKLGTNDLTDRPTPVTTFAGGADWKQMSAGSNHASAVKTDGTLWAWGLNDSAQLGVNDITNRSIPVTTFATLFVNRNNWKQVSCGNLHTTGIKTNETLWVWGRNDFGQLGTNDTITRSIPVTTFAGGANWKQVSSGNGHTTAIKTDGTLWAWGRNDNGQLGVNITGNKFTPVSILSGGTWKQVSSGNRYTAAIKTDGTLWVWGRNINGQLGVNDTSTKPLPVTTFAGGNNWKQVFCSDGHTSAIKTNGTLWNWGRNDNGQLGTNDTTSRLTPVTTFAGGSNWKQVSSGLFFSSAIKTDGTLWTWGTGSSFVLGINNTTNRLTPVTTFAGGSNWKQVSSSASQTYAVTSGTDPTLFIT